MSTLYPGYYCIIQYQHSPARHEGINVGVVVVCEQLQAIHTLMTRDYGRIHQCWPRDDIDDVRIASSLRAIEDKLRQCQPTERGLAEFAACEMGPIAILAPRPIVIDQIEASADILYAYLVDV